jgi:steroid 5-alpha reductase family enzyme
MSSSSSSSLSVIPGDDHNLLLTAVVTVAMQLAFFAVAFLLQFDKVTDFAGSTNFILLALLTLFAGGDQASTTSRAYTPRQIAMTASLLAARAYLAFFLLYRVLRRGKDDRFDAVRGNCVSFLVFWVFQMIWVWVVSLPVVFVNSDPALVDMGASDWAGLAMVGVGLLVEAAADVQKDAFRADPANRGRTCDVGVWAWSRHPNYFGEMLLTWGLFVLGAAQYEASSSRWGYVAVLSPLFTMFILLLGSGMPTAEGDNQKRFMRTPAQRVAFLRYRDQTSPLVPLPPALYRALPLWIKRWALFEWKRYETDWSYVGGSGEERLGAAAGGSSGSSGGSSDSTSTTNAAVVGAGKAAAAAAAAEGAGATATEGTALRG